MCDLPDSPEKMGFLAKERGEKSLKRVLVKGRAGNMLEFLMEILFHPVELAISLHHSPSIF